MPNTRTLSRSRCRSRLASTSASRHEKASMSDAASTASAASMVNGPANTESAWNAAVASASSSRTLHSIVLRTVRCRSGRSRAPPTSRLSAESSRSRISCGDIVRVARGCKLDRKGHAVQCADDSADGAGGLVAQLEGRVDRHRPVDEERDGARGGGIRHRRVGVGHRERTELERALGPHAQRRPARHEQLQPRKRGDQAHEISGGIDHVLHVVDDEQQIASGQRGQQLGLEGLVAGVAHADGPRDHADHPLGRGDRLEHREGDLAAGLRRSSRRSRSPGATCRCRPGRRS